MLAIAGGKGGCGKTTTTLGVAAALARRRESVLAVDADVDMPNLHAVAEVDSAPGLAAVGAGDAVGAVARPSSACPGVSVIPSAPSTADDPDRLAALDRIDAAGDVVLVDCPAGAGRAAAAPLRIADHALLVTTPEPHCLRDVAKTAAMARELDAAVVGVAVTRASRAPDGVDRLLSCPVLATVPEVAASSAAAVLSDSDATASYERLASALATKHL